MTGTGALPHGSGSVVTLALISCSVSRDPLGAPWASLKMMEQDAVVLARSPKDQGASLEASSGVIRLPGLS